MRLRSVLFLACWALGSASAAESVSNKFIAKAENVFADTVDAFSAIGTIDSGLISRYGGRDRRTWAQVYREKRRVLVTMLARAPREGLSQSDARAITVMRRKLESLPPDPENSEESMAPTGHCQDAERKELEYGSLRKALYTCFDEIGSGLKFEGARLTRGTALDMLERIEQPERRKALFLAFTPLWQSINGNNQPDSPYRRMIRMAAMDAAKHGSPIEEAAGAAGASSAQVEAWLEQTLDTWRQASRGEAVEPWDFDYLGGEAERILGALIPRESLQPIAERCYRDLGADLPHLGVLYDLYPRPGKAPLAYSDVARFGRMVHGVWQPTVPRVSANYAYGGLSALNELIHENGHAVHYAALRTRPAFTDYDSLFGEAFADVPSWNTSEPGWQRKYLGREVSESVSLRGLYSGVVQDVAWSLFEIRMLRNPAADPNALWTDITSRYLHVVPHPEWSWWAMRAQLVESPGYMVNYGLGAVLTADMRQRVRGSLGPFETGNPLWYGWVSEHLLRYGMEREVPALMREFLGRPVSPEALLTDIRKLGKPQN